MLIVIETSILQLSHTQANTRPVSIRENILTPYQIMALWLLCLGIVCVCVFLFALLAHTPPHSFLHARSSSNYFPRKFCMMTQRDQFNGNEFWIFLLLLTILLKLCFFPLSLYMRVVFTFIVSFLFNFQIRYRFTLISFQIREWIAEISVSGSL